jgi:transposase
MEYKVKIFSECQLEGSQLWKYNFLDTQTNKRDCFYHDKQISYNPNIIGKLTLNENKFLQSFEWELTALSKEDKKEEILINSEREIDYTVDKIVRKSKRVSIELEHLQHLRELGFSHWEIGIAYKRCERTIYRWLKPSTEPLQKRGVKPIITDEVASLARSYALENTTKTQQEITDYICKKLDIKISRPSIAILLKKLGITDKKLTYHYHQLDEVKAKEFNEKIKPLLTKYPFIAIDECSFYTNQNPRFGYSLKGERAIAKRPSNQGKRYTLLFAISNYGVLHWELVEGSVNWKTFYDFSEKINPIGDKKNIMLIDNARIHIALKKRKEAGLPTFKEQMAKKNIEVRYIVPYAPMLNTAELCFNLLRQQTEKQKPRSYKEMREAIEKVVDLLNTKDLSKYFWHCANYFDRKDVKNKLKITDI